MIKLKCSSCGEVFQGELPIESKIVKEPCRCGVTAEVRLGRMLLVGVALVAFFVAASVTSCDYIELKKIETLRDHKHFDVKTSPNGKLIVIPKEPEKK